MEDNFRIRTYNQSTEKTAQKITDETSKYDAPVKHVAFPKSLKDLDLGEFKLRPPKEDKIKIPSDSPPAFEDPVLPSIPLPSQPHAFFLICDGYGGKQAADYTTQQLYNHIFENPLVDTDTKQAIIGNSHLLPTLNRWLFKNRKSFYRNDQR
jgi:hypothetical protein